MLILITIITIIIIIIKHNKSVRVFVGLYVLLAYNSAIDATIASRYSGLLQGLQRCFEEQTFSRNRAKIVILRFYKSYRLRGCSVAVGQRVYRSKCVARASGM